MEELMDFLKTKYYLTYLNNLISASKFKKIYDFLVVLKNSFFLLLLMTYIYLEWNYHFLPTKLIPILQEGVALLIIAITLNSDYRLLGDNQKLNLISYINSGLFCGNNKVVLVKKILNYYSRSTFIYVLIIELCNIFFLMVSGIHIFFILENVILLMCSLGMIPKRIKSTLLDTNTNIKNSTLILIKISVVISLILLPPFNRMHENFIFRIINQYFFAYFFILFITLVLLFLYKKPNERSQNIKDYFFHLQISDLLRDFLIREAGNRLSTIIIIALIMSKLPFNKFAESLIITAILIFLYSQFNQRYILNKKLFSYLSMYTKKTRFLNFLFKELLPFQLILAAITYLIIFKMNFLYTGFSLMFYLLFLSIHQFIYINIINVPETSQDQLNQIEKLSGFFTLMILLGGILWIIG